MSADNKSDQGTNLDRAHEQMQLRPDDDALRARFMSLLADCELFLPLKQEPKGDEIAPELLDLEGGTYLRAYDSEERLSQGCQNAGEGGVPYIALSGRILARMLAGSQVGLALNLNVAPSSMLLSNDMMRWVNEVLDHAPETAQGHIASLHAPRQFAGSFLDVLSAKLVFSASLAQAFWLCRVVYKSGEEADVLAILGAEARVEEALAKAVQEAVLLAGEGDTVLDVLFLTGDEPLVAALERLGERLIFERSEEAPNTPQNTFPTPPSRDPDKPPILR